MRQTARCLTGSVAFGTKGAWLLPQLACTLLSQMGQGPSRLGEVPDIVRLAPQNPALAQGDHHEPERDLGQKVAHQGLYFRHKPNFRALGFTLFGTRRGRSSREQDSAREHRRKGGRRKQWKLRGPLHCSGPSF